MAAAIAALKLGSLVKDVAICSTKNCCNTGGLTFFLFAFTFTSFSFGLVRSRVMVCEDKLWLLGQGTDDRCNVTFRDVLILPSSFGDSG